MFGTSSRLVSRARSLIDFGRSFMRMMCSIAFSGPLAAMSETEARHPTASARSLERPHQREFQLGRIHLDRALRQMPAIVQRASIASL